MRIPDNFCRVLDVYYRCNQKGAKAMKYKTIALIEGVEFECRIEYDHRQADESYGMPGIITVLSVDVIDKAGDRFELAAAIQEHILEARQLAKRETKNQFGGANMGITIPGHRQETSIMDDMLEIKRLSDEILQAEPCPECGGIVENGVCQTAGCKGMLS